MELTAVLELIKDYGLANVLVVAVLLYLLRGKVNEIMKVVGHVDNAVNNRDKDAPTLSQEVSLIRQELGLFKKESLSIMKDFKLLRKEGYLVAAELKADIENLNGNLKQSSKSNVAIVKTIRENIEDINNRLAS